MAEKDDRVEYIHGALNQRDAPADPNELFQSWFSEVISAGFIEPHAVVLGTATLDGVPSLRTVLLKSFDERGFVFFTNYLSQKGRELEANPRGALLFYWDKLERQVRISGSVSKIAREESEHYFRSRPRGAQLAAYVSRQSQEVEDREALEKKFLSAQEKFLDNDITCPKQWGGYRLVPARFEFWQGRENRLHDRLVYMRTTAAKWKLSRLQP